MTSSDCTNATQLQILMDIIVGPVIVFSTDGAILDLNGAAESLFSTEREFVIGKSMDNCLSLGVLSPEDVTALIGIIEKVVVSKKNENRDMNIFGEDFNVSVYPFFNCSNEVAKTVAIFMHRDKHLDENAHSIVLSPTIKRQIDIVKMEILANLSHELRTPMHGILSFAKFGIDKIGRVPEETLRKYFFRIYESGNRLMVLLNDLLDLSKLDAKKMIYDFRENSIEKLIDMGLSEFESIFNERNIFVTVRNEMIGELVRFDFNRILQVVRNLLSNAVKFSPDNGKLTVVIEKMTVEQSDKSKNYCKISFIDNGIGVPLEERENIFNLFIRGSNARGHQAGTGLGLAISKEIIIAHHGDIWVDGNGLENGSVFSFTIPIDN